MKTQMIKKINNIEVVGELSAWEVCEGFLHLNWEGNVHKVLHKAPRDISWYEPIDKGGIPLYGFDGNGNVICGCVLLRKGVPTYSRDGVRLFGEQDENGQTYPTDVIYVAKANRTDDWGWDRVGSKLK